MADARGLLATVQTIPHESKAALLIDNLGGRARQEIVGRGTDTSNSPDAIFQILLTVFGDGDLLPQLQQRFFSYLQREGETLVTCSLCFPESVSARMGSMPNQSVLCHVYFEYIIILYNLQP